MKKFLPLLLLFLLMRFTTLLTAVESVAQPEELYRGTIAKEILQGPKVSLFDYQADPYDGGSLVVGFLTAPFFLIFGPSLFALKLVPLLFSLASLALLFLFLVRFFDSQSAVIACLLFILAPPGFTGASLGAVGSQTESIFFSIGMLYCFYRFLYEKRPWLIWLALFGFVSGVGCWFTSMTAITLLACLTSWFLMDRRFLFSKKLAIFSAAFSVGLLPFIAYNLTHNYAGIRFIAEIFTGFSSDQTFFVTTGVILEKVVRLLLLKIPDLFLFESVGKMPAPALAFLYYGLCVWPIVVLYFKEGKTIFYGGVRGNRVVPLMLTPIFFVILYGLNRFEIAPTPTYHESRYVAPLIFLSFPLISLGLPYVKFKKFILILLFAIGIIGQSSLLLREPAGKALLYKGYSYFHTGLKLGKALFPGAINFQEDWEVWRQFPPEERPFLYWGIIREKMFEEKVINPARVREMIQGVGDPFAFFLFEALGYRIGDEVKTVPEDLQLLLAEIPTEGRRYFYRTLDYQLMFRDPSALPNLRDFLDSDSTHEPRWFYYNVGQLLGTRRPEAAKNILKDSDQNQKAWIFRGWGQVLGEEWLWDRIATQRFLNSIALEIPREAHSDLFWGIGWSIRGAFPDDRVRAFDWLKNIPEEFRSNAQEGMKAFEVWYGL